MSTAQKILEKLESIERLLSGLSMPVQSFSPGGKDWMLTATDEQIREYNRQQGLERKRRGKPGERASTSTARRRPKV